MSAWPEKDWNLSVPYVDGKAEEYEEELKGVVDEIPFSHSLVLNRPCSRNRRQIIVGEAAFIINRATQPFAFYYWGQKFPSRATYDFVPDGVLLIPKPQLLVRFFAEWLNQQGLDVLSFSSHPSGYPEGNGVLVWEDEEALCLRFPEELPKETDAPLNKVLRLLMEKYGTPMLRPGKDESRDLALWYWIFNGLLFETSFPKKP